MHAYRRPFATGEAARRDPPFEGDDEIAFLGALGVGAPPMTKSSRAMGATYRARISLSVPLHGWNPSDQRGCSNHGTAMYLKKQVFMPWRRRYLPQGDLMRTASVLVLPF